jgi:hypothetical protein
MKGLQELFNASPDKPGVKLLDQLPTKPTVLFVFELYACFKQLIADLV